MLVCIDWLNTKKPSWQKEWGELDPSVRVVTLEGAETIDLTGITLILIHASVFKYDFEEQLTELKNNLLGRFQGAIGVVTAGSQQEHNVTDGGRVCIVRNPFPEELKALQPKVMQLLDGLSKALAFSSSEERRVALSSAWEQFDQVARSPEFLPAVAILCQGFLAVYAAQNSDENVWRDSGVIEALNRMGWVSEDTKDGKYRIAPEVADLDISQKLKDVQNVSGFWLDVFRDHPDEARRSVVERLRDEVAKEWNADRGSFKDIAALLTRLDEGSLDDDNAPKDVANAYCATADQLGSDA